MKKTIIFFLAATTFFCNSLNAQETRKKQQTTFALIGGANINRFVGTNSKGQKLNHDFVEGGQFGVNLEIPIFPGFYIQPGIQAVSKGTKNTSSDFRTTTVNALYVEVPVYIVAKPRVGEGSLIIGVGVDISNGITGTWKTTDELFYQNNRNGKVKFQNDADASDGNNLYMRSRDISMGFVLGYQFGSHFFLQMKSQRGLTNIIADYHSDNSVYSVKTKYAGHSFSIGCRF